MTIKREKGHFDNLTIGVCGDLKFGRTVHSLIAAMSRYEGIKFVLISPEELKVPSYVKMHISKTKVFRMSKPQLLTVLWTSLMFFI